MSAFCFYIDVEAGKGKKRTRVIGADAVTFCGEKEDCAEFFAYFSQAYHNMSGYFAEHKVATRKLTRDEFRAAKKEATQNGDFIDLTEENITAIRKRLARKGEEPAVANR